MPEFPYDPDNPLAGIPDPFGPPMSGEEETRRTHITDHVLTAVDGTRSREDRIAALTHMLACDPVRALATMSELTIALVRECEQAYGDAAGTAVRLLRGDLAEIQTEAQFAKATGAHLRS